jgi:phospholipid/cholesterol/gamma-HCH transport system substrate-binding protein
MRRILVIAGAVLVVGLLIFLPGATGAGSGGTYKVRGYFDNGAFIVKDEEVRVAGARVGSVESVDVSGEDEIVSLEGGPHPVPGKAVVVMKIEDDAFKDFREDASCIIRPQSLIGEKFVDCEPTQPRAPGSPPPPELEEIPDGEPGAGQRRLPLENNGKTVDLDLIQNIQRAPFRDRFRLILNDLGAGLAARGEDLGAVIDRANPALRETNQVLAILANQNRELASLASDGDRIMRSLAANKTSITGFFRNASIAGEATAERGDALEAGLQKFPATLRQLRLTMNKLKDFTDQGVPLVTDINSEAADLSKATQKLSPFAKLAVPAFQTLGANAQAAGPKLVAADPVLQQLNVLGQKTGPASVDLQALLDSLAKTNGFKYLMDFIYGTAGTINSFDAVGHFQRANLQVTACQTYQPAPFSGCEAFFRDPTAPPEKKKKKKKKKKGKKSKKARAKFRGGAPGGSPGASPGGIDYSPQATPVPEVPDIPDLEQLLPPTDPPPQEEGEPEDTDGSELKSQRMSVKQANAFLRFLLGEGA